MTAPRGSRDASGGGRRDGRGRPHRSLGALLLCRVVSAALCGGQPILRGDRHGASESSRGCGSPAGRPRRHPPCVWRRLQQPGQWGASRCKRKAPLCALEAVGQRPPATEAPGLLASLLVSEWMVMGAGWWLLHPSSYFSAVSVLEK